MILGISLDTVEDNAAFAAKYRFPFQLLSDPSRNVALAYGAVATLQDSHAKRITYVIGQKGEIEQAIATKDPAGQARTLACSL